MIFFYWFNSPSFWPPQLFYFSFYLKENVLGKCIVYNYGRLTTVVIWIFSFSSMFVITFEFYMVISDISSCFFDRCFLHQSAPMEAWRITLSNPTKTWSLGSNQVPLYLHKLLLGLGGGCTLSTGYCIQFSQKQVICIYS